VGPSQRYTGGEMLPQDFWFEAYKIADRLMLGDCGYGFDESFKDFVFGRFRYLFPSGMYRGRKFGRKFGPAASSAYGVPHIVPHSNLYGIGYDHLNTVKFNYEAFCIGLPRCHYN
jgi:hypothetical protein